MAATRKLAILAADRSLRTGRAHDDAIDDGEIVIEGGRIARRSAFGKPEVCKEFDGRRFPSLDMLRYEALHHAIGVAERDGAIEAGIGDMHRNVDVVAI